ncbi:HAD family hydrolase [Gardnerella vaginalis]|uniref:HAD family hydrolase n=1 Tax=Gardnerella vaginalis TaxID=2702 RepID=UPI0039F105B3
MTLLNNSFFKAAIFDFDGTLIDSLGVWDDIDRRSFAKRGMSVPEIFANNTATMKPRQIADYVIEHYGFTDSPEALMKEWSDMAFDAYANHLPLRKGAYDYVHYLRSQKIKMLLITTLSKSLCEPALKRTGILDCFDFLQFGEDLPEAGKNSYKTYIDIAQQIHISPEYCAVFEDSATALHSAQQANMKTYGIVDDANAEIACDSPFTNCLAVFSDFTYAPKS